MNIRRFNEFLDPMGKWTPNEDNDVQNPKFSDKNAEDFLLRLGIDITKATGEYKPGVPEEPNCGIRVWPSKEGGSKILYSFKIKEDCNKFENYLTTNNIEFEKPRHGDAVGARYPYQVIIKKKSEVLEGAMANQKSINQLKKAAKGTTKTTTGAKTPKNVQSYEQHVKGSKKKK